MPERIDPEEYRRQVREDIEERQRLYRRPRPTPQEQKQLQEAVNRSRPDLLATMPTGQHIKIFTEEGNRPDWDNVEANSLIMPHRYTWAITREEITMRLFMDQRGPKKIMVFIVGSPSSRPREEEHFLAEVLVKKEAGKEEQTTFKVAPPTIGQVKAGQVVAIRPEIAEQFGYWQRQDGQIRAFKPETASRQEPRNLKLAGF